MGSSPKQTTTTQANNGPWSGQTPAVSDLLSSANNIMQDQQGIPSNPLSASNLYSPINSYQVNGANALTANGQAAYGYAPGAMDLGYGALSGLPSAESTGTNFATGNYNQGNSYSGQAASQGTVAGTLLGQMGLGSAQQQIAANNPQSLVAGAGAMIDNPLLQGEINAAGTDINRNLTQSTLPQLNSSAMASGNMDSTRAGVAQGVDEANAQEQLLNSASAIRSGAYTSGLNTSLNQNAANISAALGQANAGSQMVNTGVYGQSADNAQVNANNTLGLQGASLLANQGALGSSLLSSGNSLGQSGAMQQEGAGSVVQQDAQSQLQAGLQAYQMYQQQPWNILNNASGIIQAQQWGQAGTTALAQTENDSTLGNLAGGGTGLAALLKLYNQGNTPQALAGPTNTALGDFGGQYGPATASSVYGAQGGLSGNVNGAMSWLGNLFSGSS